MDYVSVLSSFVVHAKIIQKFHLTAWSVLSLAFCGNHSGKVLGTKKKNKSGTRKMGFPLSKMLAIKPLWEAETLINVIGNGSMGTMVSGDQSWVQWWPVNRSLAHKRTTHQALYCELVELLLLKDFSFFVFACTWNVTKSKTKFTSWQEDLSIWSPRYASCLPDLAGGGLQIQQNWSLDTSLEWDTSDMNLIKNKKRLLSVVAVIASWLTGNQKIE